MHVSIKKTIAFCLKTEFLKSDKTKFYFLKKILNKFSFISESPRYLIQKGKISDAKKVLKRIHRVDGRLFDETVIDYVLNKENQVFLIENHFSIVNV